MAEETIDALRIVGLTEYEARVYLALVTSGSLTAKELSQESNVPYTRIYDVISRLEEKGWIEKEEGRPVRIFARAPNMALGKAMRGINERLEYARHHLDSLFVSRPKIEMATFLTINGWPSTNEMLSEMLTTVRGELMLLFGFLSNQEKPILLDALERLLRKDVKIRAIARNDPELMAELKDVERLCQVFYMPQPPPFRMTVVDWKMALATFPKVEEDGYNYEKVTTLRLNHPIFLSFVKGIATILWEEALSSR